jgi:hypothetical protein
MATLGTWTGQYVAIRDAMVKTRGAIGLSSQGRTLPKLGAWDLYGMIVALVPSIVSALERATGSKDARLVAVPGGLADQVRWLEAHGVKDENPAAIFGGSSPKAPRIAIDLWMSGRKTTDPMVRVYAGDMGSYRIDHKQFDGKLQAVDLAVSYQLIIERAAMNAATFTIGGPSLPAVEESFSRLWQLFVALESAGATEPDAGLWDRVTDAAKKAAVGTGEWIQRAASTGGDLAGRVLAEAAQTVGEAAGSATSGFFDQAGLTAWIVVAAAIAVVAL